MWIAILAASAGVTVQACHAVDGDQVLMSDLALVDPRFAAAPGGQAAGFAPQPGGKRTFWPGELIRMAERNGIATSDPFQQMCFELRTRVIAPEDVAGAVRTWAPQQARIEVLEQSRFPAPLGKLVFEQPQVPREARDGSMLLRGYVLYRGSQRFPVWAKVRVRMRRTLVIAAADIQPGEEIAPEMLRTEEREAGIAPAGFASSTAELVGSLAKTRISAGMPLLLSQFEKAPEVTHGASVKVEVRDGAAVLFFDARAETSGHTGDSVSVINPATNKTFKAKVVGKNSVLVTPVVNPKVLTEVTQK
jgi:flagella basal body P-ring formation protein FlgA